MAFVSLPGEGLWVPKPIVYSAYSNLLIDASGERVAITFDAPLTGTLDSFEFRLGTVTQAPVNGLRCSFQDINSAGNPDGIDDQFRVITTGLTSSTWVAPGLVTADGTDTGIKRSVTAGQRLAAVISFDNFVAGDALEISMVSTSTTNVEVVGRCFPALFTASWSRQALGSILR
ncbi:MAG: hypothetical protein C4555_06340 [Dehalococcoidia bacterium]|nr:MAG: hypothetical protein C4555_06340 [Dehalococcoidia bacterium]